MRCDADNYCVTLKLETVPLLMLCQQTLQIFNLIENLWSIVSKIGKRPYQMPVHAVGSLKTHLQALARVQSHPDQLDKIHVKSLSI